LLRHFGHGDISVICLTVVLKLAITVFSKHNKIWGAKQIWVISPECPPWLQAWSKLGQRWYETLFWNIEAVLHCLQQLYFQVSQSRSTMCCPHSLSQSRSECNVGLPVVDSW